MACMVAVYLLHIAWGCKEQDHHPLDETVVEIVDLGSYFITKHVMDLEHEYEVLSFQEDGSYLLNAPGGEVIKVSVAGKLNKHSSAPELLGRYGSAQAVSPDSKVYVLDKVAWKIDAAHVHRYVQVDSDAKHKYKLMNELIGGESAEAASLFWLSAKRIVGFGKYKAPCTTQSSCFKKGVRVFELGGSDKIENLNIPVVANNYVSEGGRLIGGFRVLEDGSRCFWLWSAPDKLLYAMEKEVRSPNGTKREWRSWKYQLKFSNPNIEVVEFDFNIAVSQDDGRLIPPNYIAVIAKGESGKLGLYTAVPD